MITSDTAAKCCSEGWWSDYDNMAKLWKVLDYMLYQAWLLGSEVKFDACNLHE